jgi:hypothetical protein
MVSTILSGLTTAKTKDPLTRCGVVCNGCTKNTYIHVIHTVTDSIKFSFLHADISLVDVIICLP